MPGVTQTHRPIRSFVTRAGRVTPAQRRALEELWPRLGIEFSPAPLNFAAVFGRRAPLALEIGFGDGELLAATAAAEPGMDFIGIEVHEPGIGHCLLQLEQRGLTNVRLIRHDAVEVLEQQVPDAALNQIALLFPDPWPKKRHHKRRIMRPEFAALLGRKLSRGGLLHVATDWPDYAEQIETTLAAHGGFRPLAEGASGRPETKFERRGKRLGHAIWERRYRRV